MRARAKIGTHARLLRDCQDAFNLQRRLECVDEFGVGPCCTCGDIGHYKDMHAGHYYHTQAYGAVRFLPINANLQCPRCNVDLGGNEEVYRRWLIDKYGVPMIEDLDLKARESGKHHRADLEEQLIEYRNNIKCLKAKIIG